MCSWVGGSGCGGLWAPRQDGTHRPECWLASPISPLSPPVISGTAGSISPAASLEICGSRKINCSLELTCEIPLALSVSFSGENDEEFRLFQAS